jgi:hypothetical protein
MASIAEITEVTAVFTLSIQNQSKHTINSRRKKKFRENFSGMKPENVLPVYKVPPTNCTLSTFHNLTHTSFMSFQQRVQSRDPE